MAEAVKRTALFGYDCYYPGGGWNDLIGTYDSLEEAMSYVAKLRENESSERPDYNLPSFEIYQVVDLERDEVVWRST
jgi:hypothetical protein